MYWLPCISRLEVIPNYQLVHVAVLSEFNLTRNHDVEIAIIWELESWGWRALEQVEKLLVCRDLQFLVRHVAGSFLLH
jgi:hypothetical protein